MRDPTTITFGPQQAQVLQLAVAGHSDKEIALRDWDVSGNGEEARRPPL